MSIIVFIRDSQYGMPIVQSVHLVGLTLLLAAMVILNLRMAGIAMLDSPLPWLARQLRPWAVGALVVVVLSGLLIFAGTPVKYLASNPFRVKMAALGLAMIFQVVVLRRFLNAEPSAHARARMWAAGLAITFWFSVGWAGRAIAFIP
jgi:hypothetical protein